MVKEINLDLPELLGKSETVTSPGASVQLPHNATSASVALVIDGNCQQTVGVWGTNLITNGDFSNGTTGWGEYSAALSAANNILTCVGTGGADYAGATSLNMSVTAGHKYYVSARLSCSVAGKTLQVRLSSANEVVLERFTAAADTFYTLTGIATYAASGSYNIILRARFASAAEATGAIVKLKYVTFIDLTAAFGAGNEPTAEQMDAYLAAYPNSWFDGSALITTDGTPNSPSPDYPAPINAIEELTLSVSGKNLLDYSQAAIGILFSGGQEGADAKAIRTGYIRVNPSQPYYFKAASQKTPIQIYVHQFKADKTLAAARSIFDVPSIEKAISGLDSECAYVRLCVLFSENVTLSDITNAQLELGSTATTYEPYTGYTEVPLPLNGEFIGSLPDGTKDELSVDAAGNVVLLKRVGKAVFDGSADEGWRDKGIAFSFRYRAQISGAIFSNISPDAPNIICSRYQVLPWASTDETQGVSASSASSATIAFRNTAITTLADWRTWLAANPVTVYYPLAEPYTIQLPQIDPIPLPAPTATLQLLSDPEPQEVVWRYERMLWFPFEEIALTLPDAVEEIALVLDE